MSSSNPAASPALGPAAGPPRDPDSSSGGQRAPSTEARREGILGRLEGSLAAISWLRDEVDAVDRLVTRIAVVVEHGGLLATCGNGGSAAEALHLAEELTGRYRSTRAPRRAVCLAADGPALTCIANDFGFEHVFSRQAEALLRPGDALVAFSTSGRSRNIVLALETARSRGAVTIGLLGGDGGTCAALCDEAIIVPWRDSAFVQEAHQVLLHLICERLERLPE